MNRDNSTPEFELAAYMKPRPKREQRHGRRGLEEGMLVRLDSTKGKTSGRGFDAAAPEAFVPAR